MVETGKELYEKVWKKKVPFHKWQQWLEDYLDVCGRAYGLNWQATVEIDDMLRHLQAY